MIEAAGREVRAAAAEGADPTPRAVTRTPSGLSFSPERLSELNTMAGPSSYAGRPPSLDTDLLGATSDIVALSLERAITLAVENNLAVESARLTPAINESLLVAAEAQFDWVFFGNGEWSNLDTPAVVPVINGIPVGSAVNKSQSVGYDTGVRRRLTSGGTFSVSQGLNYYDNNTPGVAIFPDPADETFLELGLAQPLLRGFGADVNLAQVRLTRNLERASIETLRESLLDVVTQTERAYWSLVQSIRALQIQERLLERGVQTRDVLQGRLDFDVKPAEYSDAVARVEGRMAEVIRARNVVRQATDTLKTLMNDPELPVGTETLVHPIDAPVDAPIEFSLLDAIANAIERRPEIQRALLGIDDASIREQVASNGRLPRLDLALRARFNGLDNDPGDAYEEIGDASFVDYLAGLTFEQPIGNRGPQAAYRASRLARMQAVVQHRNAVQQAVLAVKRSLRDVVTNYALIEQTRSARLAAAENLRTLQVEEETMRGLTPDFLDLKLRRQEALASAELQEIRSIVDYNTSLADLYNATGSALERSRIQFIVPDALPED